MTYSTETYVDRGTDDEPEDDIAVIVDYDFRRGSPATGPSYYSGGEPADPDEVDFINAYRKDTGATVILTEAEQDRIYGEIVADGGPSTGRDPDEWYDAKRSGDL